MDIEQIRAMVREADYCVSAPPQYADLVLVSQVPSERTWLVTAEHGAPGAENRRVNRYTVTEEVKITPVRDFPKRYGQQEIEDILDGGTDE